MIEQLQAPRSRSLTRNLMVESVPAALAPVAEVNRPSLSLLIQFDFNSARIRPESEQALLNLTQALQSAQLQESRFAIEGHTDAKGKAEYNLRLSAQRAQAVSNFLQARGLPAARLVTNGKGSTELANVEQPFSSENRRVHIVNLD